MKYRLHLILWCVLFILGYGPKSAEGVERQGESPLSPKEEQQGKRVEIGRLFSIEKNAHLPPGAYPDLRLYLKMLYLSRPLPWPFLINTVEVDKETLKVQGTLLRPGTYEFPLGVVWWRGNSYVLPSFFCTASPLTPPVLTAADLLLPFPKEAFVVTPAARKLQQGILEENQERGITALRWQERWSHFLVIGALCLVCAPLALQLWRWSRIRRGPEKPIQKVTPLMAMADVKALQRRGQTPWPELLHVLNLIGSEKMPSLTSYELEQRFAARGERGFAEAAHLIEAFSYGSKSGQYFEETVRRIEQELAAKKLA